MFSRALGYSLSFIPPQGSLRCPGPTFLSVHRNKQGKPPYLQLFPAVVSQFNTHISFLWKPAGLQMCPSSPADVSWIGQILL